MTTSGSPNGSPPPGDMPDPSNLLSPGAANHLAVDDRDRRPSGMLAFLSRKKGRDRSPKARERGVLGKEGARVIIGP